jgi:hypothetical protein
VPGGQSVRTVFFACSSCFCSPSFSIMFCFRFWLQSVCGRSAWSLRTVHFPGSSLVVLVAFTDCPRNLAALSAWPLRTVRGTWPDCPRGQCGPSAPSGRTVRQCLAALLLGSIPLSFLSCFCVCFKESFLRLEVDP